MKNAIDPITAAAVILTGLSGLACLSIFFFSDAPLALHKQTILNSFSDVWKIGAGAVFGRIARPR